MEEKVLDRSIQEWYRNRNLLEELEQARIGAELRQKLQRIFGKAAVSSKPLSGPDGRLTEPEAKPVLIPWNLLPRNLPATLVIDVMADAGRLWTHLLVDNGGKVIGLENNGKQIRKSQTKFYPKHIYAVRVRSGMLGRLGFTRWRTVLDCARDDVKSVSTTKPDGSCDATAEDADQK